MLTRLHVRNVVLIDALDLEFHKGLTVMTGETGGGKSILLDALGLALGSRADFGLIGRYQEKAEVTACFDLPPQHPARQLLADAGIEVDDEVLLRRQLRDGKSTAMINDNPASTTLMRQVGDSLVEIQGQFEGRGLLDVKTHRELLDRYSGAIGLAAETESAWHESVAANRRLAEAEEALKQARAEEDWLSDAVRTLDEIAPQEGEEKALTEERILLADSTRIAEVLHNAGSSINDESGATELVGRAAKEVERITDSGGSLIAPIVAALTRVEAELAEASNCLKTAQDKLEANPDRFNAIEERLHLLRGEGRKHKVAVDDLPQLHIRLSKQLSGLDDLSGNLAQLQQAQEQAAQRYRGLAEKLSEKRTIAASDLDRKVMAELPDLKLEQAQFITMIERLPEDRWGAQGCDQIRFEVSANPGMKTGAIDRIASGGELARFLLALKVVLADTATSMTLIFDEVDSGVGGAVAAAVGARLARLGEAMQCLVITHSPQVASRGAHHFRIAKSPNDKANDMAMISTAESLGDDARLEEISRMLSGSTITPEARAAAVRLMQAD